MSDRRFQSLRTLSMLGNKIKTNKSREEMGRRSITSIVSPPLERKDGTTSPTSNCVTGGKDISLPKEGKGFYLLVSIG